MTISTVDYALMAGNAYQSTESPTLNRIPFPLEGSAWQPLDGELGYRLEGGFEATAYKNGNETVISFAGTGPGFTVDYLSNALLFLGAGWLDPQLHAAVRYYEQIKAASAPGTIISFTGHSLGGGLAALMNEQVILEAGGITQVYPESSQFRRTEVMPYRYTVSVVGAKRVNAVVEVSRAAGEPSFKLACVSHIPPGQRDPTKDVCAQ